MSTTMQAFCPTCEVSGPRIHRSAGTAELWPTIGEDIFNDVLAKQQWNNWIIEHEFCNYIMRS